MVATVREHWKGRTVRAWRFGVGWLVILTNRTVTVQAVVCWRGRAGQVGTALASIGPSNCQVEGKLGAHTMRSSGAHYFPSN